MPEPAAAYTPAPEVQAVREKALADALDLFVVLFDKMEEVYGLRLPEHVAYGAGFYLGLDPAERAELALCGATGLLGVGTWFDPAGAAPVEDERLRDRHRDDPPEFVSVFAAGVAAVPTVAPARWGLWYDDPTELPVAVAYRGAVAARAHPHATYDGEGDDVSLSEPTLLATLHDRLCLSATGGPGAAPRRADLRAWIAEVARRYPAAMAPPNPSIAASRGGWLLGGPDPFLPGWNPPMDLTGRDAKLRRLAAFRHEQRTVVEPWIAQALEELKAGDPGRALFLGRELHWLDRPLWHATSAELLIRAYGALGRRALAELVRRHYLQRDPGAEVYELPPPRPVVSAALRADTTELAAILEEGIGEDELCDALTITGSVEVLDMLLDEARRSGSSVDEARLAAILWRRLSALSRRGMAAADRRQQMSLVLRLVSLAPVDARAFQRILSTENAELIAAATARVDPTSRGPHGYTPLHFAVCAAIPDVVRALLDRGADARARGTDSLTPFDAGRAVWGAKPREEAQVNAMLEAAGGAPWRAAFATANDPAWTVGMKVAHAKFGEGLVEGVIAGEETKLKVRFGKDQRVLLAKFLTRS